LKNSFDFFLKTYCIIFLKMVALDAVESKGNLPWVEKYRPETLDDLVSHKEIIRTS
jgi:hypothetical protein